MFDHSDVTKWPEGWSWSIEKPVDFNKASAGKKKKFKYTIYMSNGLEVTWLTPKWVSFFIDGDDLPVLLTQAYEKMVDLLALREAELKAFDKKEVFHICKKENNSYFAISKTKYDEKGLTDKIVKTITPER